MERLSGSCDRCCVYSTAGLGIVQHRMCDNASSSWLSVPLVVRGRDGEEAGSKQEDEGEVMRRHALRSA